MPDQHSEARGLDVVTPGPAHTWRKSSWIEGIGVDRTRRPALRAFEGGAFVSEPGRKYSVFYSDCSSDRNTVLRILPIIRIQMTLAGVFIDLNFSIYRKGALLGCGAHLQMQPPLGVLYLRYRRSTSHLRIIRLYKGR